MAIKFAEAIARPEVPRGARARRVLSGPMYYLRDGLKSPALAWTFALVAGRRRADDDAVHADRTRSRSCQQRVRHAAKVAVGHRRRGADVAGDHRRHQVDRPRARRSWRRSRSGLYLAGRLIVILFIRREDSRRARAGRSARRSPCSRRWGSGCSWPCATALARGVYANEAGYGTAAVAYGTAQSTQPVQQGLNASRGGVHRLVRDLHAHRDDVLLSGVSTGRAGSRARDQHAPPSAARFNSVMPAFGG